MFGETTIFYIKIRNHPIETTIYKQLFGVPGDGYKMFIAPDTVYFLNLWLVGGWTNLIEKH